MLVSYSQLAPAPSRATRFLLLVIGAPFLLWGAPEAVETVWLCSTRNRTKLEEPAAAGPKVCPERKSVFNATEEKRLGRLEELDPMAEYKYRVRCQDLDSIEADSAALHSRAAFDLIRCPANDETPRLPGLSEFQYGYNIVTDSTGFGHSPILDIRSTREFHATIVGVEDEVCYRVPDAFVSAQDMGVSYDVPSSTDFDIIATNTLQEFQIALAKDRKDELGLTESGGQLPDPDISIGAAFADSEMLRQMIKFTGWAEGNWNFEKADFSQISYVQPTYAVHVQTAIPTEAIIQEWKRLFYGAGLKEDYFKYFAEFGTHYYVSGVLGGQLRVLFTVKSEFDGEYIILADMQKPVARAQCVAAKMGDYLFSGRVENGRRALYVCPGAFHHGDTPLKSLDQLMYRHHISCRGGLASLCPTKLYHRTGFMNWTESIHSNPAILFGNKRWIPQLLDHILVRSTVEGAEGERFRGILANFANGNNSERSSPLPPDEVKKNSIPMTRFRDDLRHHLALYLKDHAFCAKDPNNCLSLQAMHEKFGFKPLG